MASLRQIHSAYHSVPSSPGCAGEGDALITQHARSGCFDSHRGLFSDSAGGSREPRRRRDSCRMARNGGGRLFAKPLIEMRGKFGTEPGDILAAIGPGIGGCCYEVGEEVGRQFGIARRRTCRSGR